MTDDLLATCWTFAGDIDPFADDPKSPLDPVERIAALGRHGVVGADFLLADLRGRDLDPIAAALAEHGIRHRQVELLTGWWEGDAEPAIAEALELAAGIGATQLKVAPDMENPERPFWDLRDAWVRLADRAEAIGAQLMVEPMPFTNMRTIEDGARFTQAAGHPNGGIVLDYWHVVRGGSTLASIATQVDGAHVFAVELCDGTGPKDASISMIEDANTARSLPGEGAWDVRGLVGTLRDKGFDGPWGVEMVGAEWRTLELDVQVSRMTAAARSVLAG